MRKNFGSKTFLYPQPVFILASYDENGVPDAMNAAWGGVSGMNTITMCIDESHKTTKNVLATGAFTVSMATAAQVVPCDYVGIVSANTEPDKFAKAGFHAIKSEFVNAPIIAELPLTIECRLVSYDHETEWMTGEIVNVSADESILDENGKIDPAKLRPITFDPVHSAYLELGEKAGNAFRDGLQLK
ncbi:MAG: flavin reductase family protein [Clostridia bacterium]|nr:flavin reductase family protein [Clostridia bacterium]